MIVLDASAAIEMILRTPKGPAVEARLFSNGAGVPAWHAPHLLDMEVAHVLRQHVITARITAAYGQGALEDWITNPVVRHAHYDLLPRVWELRHNLSAYDAVYVALAETLDAPLITCDGRIAAATGHYARVEVI